MDTLCCTAKSPYREVGSTHAHTRAHTHKHGRTHQPTCSHLLTVQVLYGLGVNRLEALIPDIIANTNARQPYIREGFLLVFVFLPASFGPELQVSTGRKKEREKTVWSPMRL